MAFQATGPAQENRLNMVKLIRPKDIPAPVVDPNGPLAGFIPAKRNYVPREMSPEWTDARLLDHIWDANQHDGYCAGCFAYRSQDACPTPKCKGAFVPQGKLNVGITGPTGSGKTSGLVDFAARHQLPMFTVSYASSAHSTLGQFVPDADTGGLRWVKGPAWMIAQYGGLLYFDELNFFDPAVQSAFFGLIDFRRTLMLLEHPIKFFCPEHGALEGLTDLLTGFNHGNCADIRPWEGPYHIPLNPKTLVAATWNPVGEGYTGTGHLNAALSNRFLVLDYPYDEDVEAQLIRCPSIRAFGVALRTHAKDVHTPVSTNRLIDFERWIVTSGDYTLAKTIFLGSFAHHEQETVRRLLEEQYESNKRMEDNGILHFFGITSLDDDDDLGLED